MVLSDASDSQDADETVNYNQTVAVNFNENTEEDNESLKPFFNTITQAA
jgi:hypothetical protein